LAVAATIAMALAFQWSGVGHPAASGEANGKDAALDRAALVPTLHRINQMEIDAGKMAQTSGFGQAVKDYGTTLERDHQAADEKLRDYAQTNRVAIDGPVPADLERDLDQATQGMEKLPSKTGAAFDRAFAQAMKQDHDKAIQIVEKSRPLITDAHLKTLIDELEPKLRAHKQIAFNILTDMNARRNVSSQESGAAPSTVQGRRSDHGR